MDCLVLSLAVPVGVLAAGKPPAGALSIEGGKGVIVIRGNGGLLGRVSRWQCRDRGSDPK